MPPGLPAPGSTEHPRAEAPGHAASQGCPRSTACKHSHGEGREGPGWLGWSCGPRGPLSTPRGLPQACPPVQVAVGAPSTTLSAPHQAKVAVLPSAPAGSLLGVFCRWSCEPAGGECARNTAAETGRLGPNGPLPKAWRCHAPRRVRGAQNALCFPLLSPHSGQAPVLVVPRPISCSAAMQGAGWAISRRRWCGGGQRPPHALHAVILLFRGANRCHSMSRGLQRGTAATANHCPAVAAPPRRRIGTLPHVPA